MEVEFSFCRGLVRFSRGAEASVDSAILGQPKASQTSSSNPYWRNSEDRVYYPTSLVRYRETPAIIA